MSLGPDIMVVSRPQAHPNDPEVIKTDDGGETWSYSALFGEKTHGFLQVPGNEPKIVTIAESGIYSSEDRGTSWRWTGTGVS